MSFRFGKRPEISPQIPRTERALSRVSIKPVYNVAQGTKDTFMPFELLKDSSTFTYSSATIKGVTDTLDTIVSYQTSDGFPSLVQKQDTVGGYTFGDDTDLETIIYIKSNSDYEVTQCFVQAAFATNITAYTDNGVTFDSVDFEVRAYEGTTKENYNVILKKKFLTGHAQMTGADAATIFILKAQFSGESVRSSDTIGLYFKCNNTKVITNTYQSMMLPLFSFTKTDYTKTWYQSGLANHLMPSFNAAKQPFKHEMKSYPLDDFGNPIA